MLNPWLIVSFFLSIAVGITCGGNGTFSMAAAFGSDAITKRRALFLAALFFFLAQSLRVEMSFKDLIVT
jgi:hypothetical protein